MRYPLATLLFLPAFGCDDFALLSIHVNESGDVIVDDGLADVHIAEPAPWPYSDNHFPFGDDVTFTTISAGHDHVCGLRIDSEIECRGQDVHGETHPPPGPWVDVVAGFQGSCGQRSDGTIECWGFEPGYSDWLPGGPDWPAATGLSLSAVSELAMCGVDSADYAVCWGANGESPGAAPAAQFDSVDVGSFVACGHVKNSTDIECWGLSNAYGVLDPPQGTWTTVSVTDWGACALHTDGSIACWGDARLAFQNNVPSDRDFIDVGVKGRNGCGLRSDGTVTCWPHQHSPRWQPPSGWITDQMAVGRTFVCGRSAEGFVACWGMLPEPAPVEPPPAP